MSELNARINASKFVDSLRMIGSIVEECSFDFNTDGLHVRAIDPGHVSMIDLSISKDDFESFDLPEPFKAGIRVATMIKQIGRPQKDDLLDLHVSAKSETVTETDYESDRDENGKHKEITRTIQRTALTATTNGREITFPTVEITQDNLPTPKIPYSANIEFQTKAFVDILKLCNQSHDTVSIETTSGSVSFASKGELTSQRFNLERVDDRICSFNAEATKATYSLPYLLAFAKTISKTYKILRFEFAHNMPCKISLDESIAYYLAPRIEEA